MKNFRVCKTNNKVHKIKQCFQKECLVKRKELRLITKALNRNPNDLRLKQRFCNLTKYYRSLRMKFKHKHEQQLLCNLEQLHHTDTESFWKLGKLKGTKGKLSKNQHNLSPFEKSLNYIKALLQKETPKSPVKENPNIKNVLDMESLNKPFDVENVKCGLTKLKQNKSRVKDSFKKSGAEMF